MKQNPDNAEADAIKTKEYTPYVEIKILVCMVFLLAFGLIMIYSASGYTSLISSSVTGNDSEYYLFRQLRNVAFGIILMIAAYVIPYGIYKFCSVPIYIISLISILLLKSGLGVESHQATRWIAIGPMQIQISDVVKICIIIFMACMVSHYWQKLDKVRYVLLIWLLVAIPTILLTVISSNLSSGIILALMCFTLTFIVSKDVKVHSIIAGLAVAVVIIVLSYCRSYIKSEKDINELKPYQLKRVVAWLEPEKFDDDASYQSTQALYAIGSGGLLGKGLGNGTQKLSRISESQNDFIFAVICEELGLVGVVILLLLYGYLLFHVGIVIRESTNVFASTLCLGVLIHIFWQIVVNIFVVIGFFPNTGVSLPFISYGGTALMFTMGEIGLVIGVRHQQITHKYDNFMKKLAKKKKMRKAKWRHKMETIRSMKRATTGIILFIFAGMMFFGGQKVSAQELTGQEVTEQQTSEQEITGQETSEQQITNQEEPYISPDVAEAAASSEGETTDNTEDNPSDTEPVVTPKGWVTDDQGNVNYYYNGIKVTSELIKITDENGVSNYYSFDSNGNQVYGLRTIRGNVYYFDKDNTAYPGAAYKGWKQVGGYKYYFNTSTYSAYRGFKTIGGKMYYFNANSILYTSTGLRAINGYYFYFNSDNSILKSSWKTIGSNMYYFGYNGIAKTGLIVSGSSKCYFNSSAVLQKNKFITLNNVTYYFGANGQAVTGLKTINGGIYYFSASGAMYKNSWVTLSGGRYYFGSNGKAYVGANKVRNSAYYYYFNSKGVLSAGTANINGVHYRFKSTGTPYSGFYKSASGIYYYYKSNGTLTYGPQVINGYKILFSYNNAGWCRNTGWYSYSGKTYYVKNNQYVTGYQCIDGDYYYFGSNGVMLKNGWAYAKGYKFYFGSDGKRLEDVSDILGKQSEYVIKVNKQTNTVTVYAEDDTYGFIIPVKVFVCSTGVATPTGTFYTPSKYRWWTLMGPCWGQWCTRITGGVLFHSVYYNSENNNTALSVSAYNKLGTTCSHGCVRLTAGDAKWIYDNCSLNTKVIIYNSSDPGPFTKPAAAKLPSWHTWDPTDPNVQYKCKNNGCSH